jgi:hypothetical protein
MAERLMDIPVYLAVAGSIELVTLLCMSAIALVRIRPWGWRSYRLRVRRWSVFAAILLVIGCIGNSVFMAVAYERLYVSRDTVVDFLPFIPFGRWVLNDEWAGQKGALLNGASLLQIQLIWAAVAAAVWSASVLIYRGWAREQGDIHRTIGSEPRTV